MATQLQKMTRGMSARQVAFVQRMQNRTKSLIKNQSAKAAKAPLLINASAFGAGMFDEAVPFTVEAMGMSFTGSEVAAFLALGGAVWNGDSDLALMASGVTAVAAHKAGKASARALLDGTDIKGLLGFE